MTELQFDSPLKWPPHIQQTERLRRGVNHSFSQSMSETEAIGFLQDEVARTAEITSAKLTCNAINMMSPMPTQYLSKQPGASIIIKVEGQTATICCDKWQTLTHNIYALHLAIRQFRQLAEYGIGSLPILINGFTEAGLGAAAASATAAPVGGNAANGSWQQVLGLGPAATLEDANAVYRARAKTVGEHDPDGLQILNLAIQEARRHFGGV